jgi:hypothetical protein
VTNQNSLVVQVQTKTGRTLRECHIVVVIVVVACVNICEHSKHIKSFSPASRLCAFSLRFGKYLSKYVSRGCSSSRVPSSSRQWGEQEILYFKYSSSLSKVPKNANFANLFLHLPLRLLLEPCFGEESGRWNGSVVNALSKQAFLCFPLRRRKRRQIILPC